MIATEKTEAEIKKKFREVMVEGKPVRAHT